MYLNTPREGRQVTQLTPLPLTMRKLIFAQGVVAEIITIDCDLRKHNIDQFSRAKCPRTGIEYWVAPCVCEMKFDGHLLSVTLEWKQKVVGEGYHSVDWDL